MTNKVDYTGTGARLLPPPWPPISKLYKAVRAAVVEYRMSSFETFAFDIQIFREDDFSDKKPGLGYVGQERFTFHPEGDKPRQLYARLDKDGKAQLKLGRGWRPAAAYLKTLHIPMNPNRDLEFNPRGLMRCLRHQQEWWSSNGKSFNFLALPLEIRQIIYSYTVGPFVEPFPASPARIRRSTPARYRVNHRLLRTCRQVYMELAEQMYSRTTFLMQERVILCRFLSSRNFPLQNVTMLKLKLDHDQYFDLFGVHIKDFSSLVEYRWGRKFDRAMSGLSKLCLRRLELEVATLSQIELLGMSISDSCQKKVVDILLHHAWPYLRGHPVDLTGCVKTTQKLAFGAKAAGAYKRRNLGYLGWEEEQDMLDGGVRLDGQPMEEVSSEENAHEQQPLGVTLPLICECTPHCSDEWHGEDEIEGDD